MFTSDVDNVARTAKAKVDFLKRKPLSFFILSMMAGFFVGFGGLLAFSLGGILSSGGALYTKIVMGFSFSAALSLVVMAGAELFTGSNLTMAMGVARKTIGMKDLLLLWLICYLGNLFGGVFLSLLFHFSGLNTPEIASFFASSAYAKMNAGVLELFIRGILCNMLVCLAAWCAMRMKSESGKLIMIFWCLYAFVIIGFEHSVANMTVLTVGMLDPQGYELTISGYLYNLLIVTAGNIVGGVVFAALPYIMASEKN